MQSLGLRRKIPRYTQKPLYTEAIGLESSHFEVLTGIIVLRNSSLQVEFCSLDCVIVFRVCMCLENP